MINSFRGEYAFLSNFYEANVLFNVITYVNNEAAFQAQKTLDENERMRFAYMDPRRAKAKGKQVKLRPDWENVKIQIMYEICTAKFMQHPDLLQKLLETGDEYLEEGNNWGDRFWGTVNGVGQNNLGKILMKIRSDLKFAKIMNMSLIRGVTYDTF